MERQYKLLAFITLIKKYRENSVIYSYENKKVLAKNLGISYNSYKKYIDICIKEELLEYKGNNLQAINLVEAIFKLDLDKKLWKYHNFCHSYQYEKLNFKNVYDRILTSIITVNYEKQGYLVDRNEILFSRKGNSTKKSKIIRTLSKQAIKKGISTECLITSIKEKKIDKIVSGKYHVAGLIGYSHSSGMNWLRKLHERKIIKRKVVIKMIKSKTNAFKQYDFLIENIKEGKLLPVVGGFKHFKGSSIIVNSDYPVKTKSRSRIKKG